MGETSSNVSTSVKSVGMGCCVCPPRARNTLGRSAQDSLRALGVAGLGGCGQSTRESRCCGQSGQRAAPGDATGLAGAGDGVCAGVFSRHSIYPAPWAAGVVGAAAAGFLEAEKAFRRPPGHKKFQHLSTHFGLQLSFNTKRQHNHFCHPL